MRKILLGSFLVLLAACSDDDGGPTNPPGNPPGNPPANTITLQATSFSPVNLPVTVGTTVTWNNTSGIRHTITPDGHSAWTRVDTSDSGQILSVTFDTPGTYAYFCEPHSGANMQGTITVTQ